VITYCSSLSTKAGAWISILIGHRAGDARITAELEQQGMVAAQYGH
jgi:hypothetical protein